MQRRLLSHLRETTAAGPALVTAAVDNEAAACDCGCVCSSVSPAWDWLVVRSTFRTGLDGSSTNGDVAPSYPRGVRMRERGYF